ncbi:MAG TPA: class II fructose-bisphosphate aldolase [Bacillota bacterium]|jgi:fructose/tagatose bisphosphate aldolase
MLSGRELARVFEHFSPFEIDGSLKPQGERVTILAANANLPLEIQARAFAMAAAEGDSSPLIVQLSHNALSLIGGDPEAFPAPPGVQRDDRVRPVIDGAVLGNWLIEEFAAHYGAEWVAVSLDHFKLPAYVPPGQVADPGSGLAFGEELAALDVELAERRVVHALAAVEPVHLGEVDRTEETLRSYVTYLCSARYRQFKQDFMAVIGTISPAWAMIDTEKLPPVLDFAVTRDVIDGVRDELGNDDVVIEAEYGATGTRGQAIQYTPTRGADLESLARQVAAFIAYTGAEAIAYPIGMEHAARSGEAHEPDVERLSAVQREILTWTGRYVPFVQHGGTGAATVVRGLVGKDNVNTHFLVAGANALADWVLRYQTDIRAGDKKAAGTGFFTRMTAAVFEATVDKLKECGSYQTGPEIEELLDD